MKVPNKPVLLAMASLLVIVGLVVSGSWYILNNKQNATPEAAGASGQPSETKPDSSQNGNKADGQASPEGNNRTTEAPKPQNRPAPDSQTTKNRSIAISASGFSPAELTVKKGASVTWTNGDSAAHAIASESGSSLHSPQLQAKQSYTYTFATSGTYRYFDAMDPDKAGTITVTD